MRGRRALTVGTVAVAVLAPAGCGGRDVDVRAADSGVTVLAKEDGWRQTLREQVFEVPGTPYGLIEVAYDAPTGRRAWEENRPAVETARSGAPTAPGVYGDPAAVDYAEQVLVVWSGGQGTGCPGWLSGVALDAAGRVRATTGARVDGGCGDAYNTYRMVLVVDRDRLPPASTLPRTDGSLDGRSGAEWLVVAAYPYEPGG